jgi:hypothetical protein
VHTVLFAVQVAGAPAALPAFPAVAAAAAAAAGPLLYRGREQLRAELERRGAASAAPPQGMAPAWEAMSWSGRAFARSLRDAGGRGVVVCVEPTPMLPVSRAVSSICGGGVRTIPILRGGGGAGLCAAVALAERLPGVGAPHAALAAALACCGADRLLGVWLGCDDAKPWRARPWARPGAEEGGDGGGTAVAGERRCLCDSACAVCAPEPWWAELRCLCTHRLAADKSGAALVLGLALPHAAGAEVWQGMAVDRLLAGCARVVTTHAPDWGGAVTPEAGGGRGAEWVARYAMGSPRLALALHLERRPSAAARPAAAGTPSSTEARWAAEPAPDHGAQGCALGGAARSAAARERDEAAPSGLARWSVCRGWDAARAKQPPPAAAKYARLRDAVLAALARWAVGGQAWPCCCCALSTHPLCVALLCAAWRIPIHDREAKARILQAWCCSTSPDSTGCAGFYPSPV